MLKAYRYRLYPNNKQIELINKTIGCCRFVYNYYLNKRIELYKTEHKTFGYNSCAKDLANLKKRICLAKKSRQHFTPTNIKRFGHSI